MVSQLAWSVICVHCGAATKNRNHYCDDCQIFYEAKQKAKSRWGVYQEEQERSGQKRIYQKAFWKRLREQVLRRDGYLCCECARQGRIKPASEVDHIVPVARGGDNSLSNLQSLCHECHREKTRRESHERKKD